MNIENIMSLYLESKTLAWAPTTMKSERHRLNAIIDAVTGDPKVLWASLKDHAPYSRLTIWTRVSDMWDWSREQGFQSGDKNPYRAFKKQNARLFKNAYRKQPAKITYQEAKSRIAQIQDPESRAKAEQLLQGGLRYTESLVVRDGKVSGKGGREREVFVRDGGAYSKTYQTLRRHLAAVGLKPHDLRKCFASAVVERGANGFELMEMMGWADIATATSYISISQSRARSLAESVQKGIKDDDSFTPKQASPVLQGK